MKVITVALILALSACAATALPSSEYARKYLKGSASGRQLLETDNPETLIADPQNNHFIFYPRPQYDLPYPQTGRYCHFDFGDYSFPLTVYVYPGVKARVSFPDNYYKWTGSGEQPEYVNYVSQYPVPELNVVKGDHGEVKYLEFDADAQSYSGLKATFKGQWTVARKDVYNKLVDPYQFDAIKSSFCEIEVTFIVGTKPANPPLNG